MAQTITFIALKQVEAEDTEGNPIFVQRRWSREELVEKVANSDAGLFSVSQAHAFAVLIPQGKYQEVFADILEDGAAVVAADDDEDNDDS